MGKMAEVKSPTIKYFKDYFLKASQQHQLHKCFNPTCYKCYNPHDLKLERVTNCYNLDETVV